MRRLVEDAARKDTRVRYIHLDQRGLSRARNAGIAASGGEIVAMTDDDCEADPGWLETLARCFADEPEVGLVGGALLRPERVSDRLGSCPALNPSEALYDPVPSRRQAPAGWDWIGGNFALRRGVAECTGLFDEHLGAGTCFPSGEDTDYKLRLEARGVKMRSTPRAIVHHTYGVRRGLRPGLRHSASYARGNGALAAKLTLSGDSRGQEWLNAATRESASDWLTGSRPYRVPVSILRLWHFRSAYHECLHEYAVDPGSDVLYHLAADQRPARSRGLTPGRT